MMHGYSHAAALTIARQHAEGGRFGDFRALCRQVAAELPDDLIAQLDLGGLLSSYGFLTDARACYEKAQTLVPTDLRAQVIFSSIVNRS